MKTYSGRLWLVPHRDTKLRVEIELDEETIKITSNDNLIGQWPLAEVMVRTNSRTETRLIAEGEELVIFTRDVDFVPALAAHKSQADRAADEVDRQSVAVRPKDSIDTNVVSFDRDRRPRQATAAPMADEPRTAAAGGDVNGAESSESDRGAHRDESRMLWKW